MLAGATLGEVCLAQEAGLAAPIIPEVTEELRELIFVIELVDLISVAEDDVLDVPTFSSLILFDALGRATRQLTATFDAVGQPGTVAGDTFWLAPAPAGNDANPGSEAQPWATLAKANSMVGPGDLVILKPGTYNEEDIILDVGGTAGNPVTYQSQVRHSAIIRPIDNQAGLEVILCDADYLVLDGLQIDGTPYPEVLCGITQQGSNTDTKNCWVHHIRCLGSVDGGAGILTGDGPTADYDQVNNRVFNCKVHDIGNIAVPSALVHGIYLTHFGAQAFNNLVYRVEGGGIHLWHNATDIQVHNNTVFACGNSGLILGHGDHPGVIANTKVSNNVALDCPTGIRTSGSQGTGNEARNNTCFNCAVPFSIAGGWAQAANSTVNPGLVNYQIDGSGDYTPLMTGAAANSGMALWAPAFDYTNLARPKSTGFDRGAFEAPTLLRTTFNAVGAVHGLINFGANNTTRYYSIPSNAALNLGSGAWAWFMWYSATANAGTDYNYLLSASNIGVTPQWNVAYAEASVVTVADRSKWHMRIGDNVGVDGALYSSAQTFAADGINRLIVVQSTGTTLEMWSCREGQTAFRQVNAAVNVGALTAANGWHFGRRLDGDADNYFEASAGGLGKANVALSQADIEAIAGGAMPTTVLGANLAAWWRFGNGAGATEVDAIAGIVATRQGTGW